MPENENPIICGRRNCKQCTRWRLITDFKWRWRKRRVQVEGIKSIKSSRHDQPTISTICLACARENERNRYNGLSDHDKKARVHKAVEQAKVRRQKHRDQIHYMRMARERRHNEDKMVPLVPFRMWLLGRIRQFGGDLAGLAREAHIDEKQFRRWADGYDWDYEVGHAWAGCEPKPIYAIAVRSVDLVGVQLGEPDLLERLYPYADKED